MAMIAWGEESCEGERQLRATRIELRGGETASRIEGKSYEYRATSVEGGLSIEHRESRGDLAMSSRLVLSPLV